jgi:hypothetical protein
MDATLASSICDWKFVDITRVLSNSAWTSAEHDLVQIRLVLIRRRLRLIHLFLERDHSRLRLVQLRPQHIGVSLDLVRPILVLHDRLVPHAHLDPEGAGGYQENNAKRPEGDA